MTAGALRAAHGTVRCGRCGSAFDALPRLSDAVPTPGSLPHAIPMDLGSSTEFAGSEVVDLAPVIEAELARLDQAELARLQATDFDMAGDSTAESTVVLVDEGGTAEDITLEGEEVKFEGLAESPAEEPAPDERPDYEPAEAPLGEDEEAEIEAEYDLDATDRFEALRIPPSAYPDPQEAEREFEALVQRLQREFDSRTISLEGATESDEETAETVSLGAEPGLDQTALLEPLDAEYLERELSAGTAPSRLDESHEAPEAAEPPAAVAMPSSAESPWPQYPPVVPLPSTGDAAAASEPILEAQPAPEPTDRSQPEAGAAAVAAADSKEGPVREAAVVVPVGERPLSARRWRPPPDELEAETAPARSLAGVLAWSLGSVLLALALGAQVVHHFRQELAGDSRFEPTLRTVYERLGVPLPPRLDLGALELRQSGDDQREGGRMVVRASVANRASFTQPLPVLRLQLEDRYGVTVAERDFEPADYLKDPARATRPLAAGESSEAELVLADPGTDAVGYRLVVCQRESPTLLRCASGRD